jgi:hypothetical protein
LELTEREVVELDDESEEEGYLSAEKGPMENSAGTSSYQAPKQRKKKPIKRTTLRNGKTIGRNR